MNRKRIILVFLNVLIVVSVIFIYLVYHGYVLLNNPSKRVYPISGVDVSHYQGIIDWDILGNQGVIFAYIKATEGSSHVDECFLENWKQAPNSGIIAGAYHFFSFDSPGKDQAEHYIDIVEKYDGMLPPAIDVEYYADKKVNPPNPEDVQRELQILVDELQNFYGMKVVVYSTEEIWNEYLKGHFNENPIWIRNIFTTPGIEEKWTFWQYSNRGRLKGYSGDESFIDLNVFYGNKNEWDSWLESNKVE